jgi:hypothetical protein
VAAANGGSALLARSIDLDQGLIEVFVVQRDLGAFLCFARRAPGQLRPKLLEESNRPASRNRLDARISYRQERVGKASKAQLKHGLGDSRIAFGPAQTESLVDSALIYTVEEVRGESDSL